MSRSLHEDNRRAWNAATEAHNSHKGDQARFLRQGGDTLRAEELALLGDVSGLDLLHLQCNAGQDSLSLARRGARVLGVDISDSAISFAKRLSTESGIPAEFERADVYPWLAAAAEKPPGFDVCFCSYGALMWLSDLKTWARGIAHVLRPGGRLVVVDFHPLALVFDEEKRHFRSYFSTGTPHTDPKGIGDYVAQAPGELVPWGYQKGVEGFVNPNPSHEFQWTLADILSAVLEAGLALSAFEEYPRCQTAFFHELVPDGAGSRVFAGGAFDLPLLFGLVARQPEIGVGPRR